MPGHLKDQYARKDNGETRPEQFDTVQLRKSSSPAHGQIGYQADSGNDGRKSNGYRQTCQYRTYKLFHDASAIFILAIQ